MSDAARPGALVIGASRLGKVAGVKGTGTVARITFRAVAAGASELGFEGKALDAVAAADGRAHPPGAWSRSAARCSGRMPPPRRSGKHPSAGDVERFTGG